MQFCRRCGFLSYGTSLVVCPNCGSYTQFSAAFATTQEYREVTQPTQEPGDE